MKIARYFSFVFGALIATSSLWSADPVKAPLANADGRDLIGGIISQWGEDVPDGKGGVKYSAGTRCTGLRGTYSFNGTGVGVFDTGDGGVASFALRIPKDAGTFAVSGTKLVGLTTYVGETSVSIPANQDPYNTGYLTVLCFKPVAANPPKK